MEGNATKSSGGSTSTPSSSSVLKRKSNDIGWDYGHLVDPNNLDKVQCRLCGKVTSGGAYRLKEHIGQITGNVTRCPKATPEDINKCKQALMEAKKKKMNKRKEETAMRKEVNIVDVDEEVEEIDGLGARKEPHVLGPMDRFVSAINPSISRGKTSSSRQQNISDALFKERTLAVEKYIGRWVYESGIPFNAVDNDSFKMMIEAIGQFGPGLRAPSQYRLREPILQHEVARTKSLLKEQEEQWAKTGCSIMTDAWSDRKRRSIMNLCVNGLLGTTFLRSKECSDEAHTAEFIFQYVDECIEEVGVENVVQVVTDNASNNMAAAKLLKEKRPKIFWSSCATHTINLMLEGIGKMPKYKKVIDQAKALTIFIYAHHKTLSLMRSFTKKRDIVRPGVTRFASNFLTLQSLIEKKIQLRHMFSSNEWEECKFARSSKGKASSATVFSMAFWNGVTTILKVFAPLVKVLRLVDGDKVPSMGFIIGELKQAKEDIKEAVNNVESNYRPIFEIIDQKMKDRLDTPLHYLAYQLNPFYYFKDDTIQYIEEVENGVLQCLDIIFNDDLPLQNLVANHELPRYRRKEGNLGGKLAKLATETTFGNFDPVAWWTNYGCSTPHLQKLAIRILALTSSSSGCERNWSVFEGIHTKKRNRIETNRLNNIVFVQFNAKLINKRQKQMNTDVDVLLANDDCRHAQGWLVAGGDEDEVDPDTGLTWQLVDEAMRPDDILQRRRSSRVRELNEDDFDSEEEEEEEEEESQHIEFESDEDRVVEDYGHFELDV